MGGFSSPSDEEEPEEAVKRTVKTFKFQYQMLPLCGPAGGRWEAVSPKKQLLHKSGVKGEAGGGVRATDGQAAIAAHGDAQVYFPLFERLKHTCSVIDSS